MKDEIQKVDISEKAKDLARWGTFAFGCFEKGIRAWPARRNIHCHQFHEMMVFKTGRGQYMGDFQVYDVEGPAVVIIPAGTVHEWPDYEQMIGHVIDFDLDFLGVTGRTEGAGAIFRPPIPVVIPLTEDEYDCLEIRLWRMQREWDGDCIYRATLLAALLTMMLVDLRCLHDEHLGNHGPASASGRLYSAFLDELEKSWNQGVNAKEIAARLNISPSHLSTTLKSVSGSSPSKLISERVLLGAKRLLAHSAASVAEVAYETGFEDPSYFTRFFRKHTGVTPKQFRIAFNEN